MPRLVVFIIRNLLMGALIGLAVACWLAVDGTLTDHWDSSDKGYLAVAMVAYSMASTFGLGFLATALLLSE
ncbi:hypothetical protein SAMN02927914_05671 [Mesorhizobium qingshengii]|uniref:Uncharacterized protein n=1 Tax=Mesorhizobium qingshengii TaxID=1165689 RepID=A0A1G5ZP45_9HYPH|nr:hypothetical protein SAMN02927914_05671 [Mesorhizobium qingshengii]